MIFEEDFFVILETVQSTTGLIEKDLDVSAEFRLSRSGRRGVTVHARNMEVGIELVNAINRWQTEANSATGNPTMDMTEVYTTLKSLLPTTLRYSRSL
jgi:hypothetical protein